MFKIYVFLVLNGIAMPHVLGMHQPFNFSQACNNESHIILNSYNSGKIIDSLTKLSTTNYSIQPLKDIHITQRVYNIVYDHMASEHTSMRTFFIHDETDKPMLCVYSVITNQWSDVHSYLCFNALQKVAKEILSYIEIDSLGSQLQATHFEDKMDLEK